MITDLMQDDDFLGINWTGAGICGCGPVKSLIRLRIGKDIDYICDNCLRQAISIVRIKSKHNVNNEIS